MRPVRPAQWALVIACAAACGAPSVRAEYDPAKIYRESPAAAARYPDPAVTYATPSFARDRQDFTSHAEVMGFLADLAARAPSMRLHVAGTSQGGRAIPVVLLTSARGEADFSDAHRPTILLIGQQHGNEPAGGEAMLVMAQRLAAGDLGELLERINVVIMPRANPDGAEAFERVLRNGIDPNRDHTMLRSPEGLSLIHI